MHGCIFLGWKTKIPKKDKIKGKLKIKTKFPKEERANIYLICNNVLF
jgi:hypothetical protein